MISMYEKLDDLPKLSPEQSLLLAVMKLAERDKDVEYFKSETFQLHCNLLKLNGNYMKRKFLDKCK